jgi:hypothetical protein
MSNGTHTPDQGGVTSRRMAYAPVTHGRDVRRFGPFRLDVNEQRLWKGTNEPSRISARCTERIAPKGRSASRQSTHT